MLKTKRLLTYEDYARLPDERRYELIEGELFMVPSPDFSHQSILRNLGFALWHFIKRDSLGLVFYAPFDVILTEHDVIQPDIVFVSNERRSILTEKNIQGGPDLVVEILSSGTRERDILVKKGLFARHGVREYWIVDPVGKSIEVMVLKEDRFTTYGIFFLEDNLESPLLPGFNHPFRKCLPFEI